MSSNKLSAVYQNFDKQETSDRIIDQVGDMEVFKQTNKSSSAFSIVERNGEQYIHIAHEKIRRLIWRNIDDQQLILMYHLYDTDKDNADSKLNKDKNSLFPFELTIKELANWFIQHDAMDYVYSEDEDELRPILGEFKKFLMYWNTLLTERYSQILIQGGEISYIGLYFALQRDEELYVAFDMAGNNIIAGRVHDVECVGGGMMSSPHMRVTLIVHIHNGTELVQSKYKHLIIEYKGINNVADHGIRLLTPKLKEQLVLRGKKYLEVTSTPSYMMYDGELVRQNWWSTATFRASGRVMIDIKSMITIDSDYCRYFSLDRDDIPRGSNRGINLAQPIITDEVLMTTPPYVYGFSFRAKQWGEMCINQIEPIKFREDAYDMLVLDPVIKNMLFALAETNNTVGKDFIDGKGGGCIFLLAGTPGTGKTLCSEVIAEKLQRPLYMVGIGELGTNVGELEENLRDILDMATSWKAILLLDEADIFMEKRDDINIERNAMVGVFLRMLEYYQGTLFLTTNRANTIDEAFYSRISLAIKFEDLDSAKRIIIWENILKLYNLQDNNIDVVKLSEFNTNGRQIKNVVRIGTALAEYNKQEVTTDTFVDILNHVIKFNMYNENE